MLGVPDRAVQEAATAVSVQKGLERGALERAHAEGGALGRPPGHSEEASVLEREQSLHSVSVQAP